MSIILGEDIKLSDIKENNIREFLKKPVVKECLDLAVHILLAVVIAVLIVNYVFQITIVHGNSMEKYLHNGDRLIVEKFIYKFKGLERGDIVTINKPQDLETDRTPIIKRVAALEGDSIEIRDGSVYVNDKKLDEPYINGTYTFASASAYYMNARYSKVVVPTGHIYVLGDNRMPDESLDSRTFGPVSLEKVEGRAVFRLYPFSGFGSLKLKK